MHTNSHVSASVVLRSQDISKVQLKSQEKLAIFHIGCPVVAQDFNIQNVLNVTGFESNIVIVFREHEDFKLFQLST
jgi:hypothetical protein